MEGWMDGLMKKDGRYGRRMKRGRRECMDRASKGERDRLVDLCMDLLRREGGIDRLIEG